MGGVLLVVRRRLRQHRGSLLVLVLLGGLGFGLTLGCLAGARRTASAFDRFVTASVPGDIEVGFDEGTVTERAELAGRVATLPQVETAAGMSWVFHILPDGSRDQLTTFVALDDALGHELYIPRVIEGRLADPDRADEVTLNEEAADRLDLEVGDTLDLIGVPADQQNAFFSQAPIEGGRPVSLDVTGIIRGPEDLVPGATPSAHLTPAYWDETVGQLAFFGPGIAIALERGQRDEFVAAVTEFLPESALSEAEVLTGGSTVSDTTRVQAAALALFAGVIGITTLAFLGLAFVRQAALARPDAAALQALGMARRHRDLVTGVPLLLAGTGGVMLAMAVAVAISPTFPFGLAGRAEPHRGLDVDLRVLAGGAAFLFVTTATLTLLATGIARRPSLRRQQERSVPVPLPLAAELGVRFVANPGRGDRALPIRSVLLTATVGVALVVGTMSFGASLDRLLQEPRRYGWDFDLVTGTSDDPDTFDQAVEAVAAEPRIGDWTAVSAGNLVADGVVVHTLAVEPIVGDALPVVIGGRLPAATDEIALGRETMAELDVSLGDTLEVRREDDDATRSVDVVGLAVLPGGDHDFPGGLGSGAVMTLDGMATLGDAPRNVYFLRAAVGTDADDLLAAFEGPGFYGPSPGDQIDNLDAAAAIVPWLAATVAILAGVALAHGFSVTVRRRRPEMAVLAALGMRPRQLRSLVRWQAGAIAVIALTAGILLGLALTKVAWGAAARGLGVADDIATLRPLGLSALVAGLLGFTLAIASWSAITAGRTGPAEALRAE